MLTAVVTAGFFSGYTGDCAGTKGDVCNLQMTQNRTVEAIFDQDFGAVFAVRSAGHVLDRAAVGSIEIAVEAVGVPLVLVLGHRRCAAVATAVKAWRGGRRPQGAVGTVVDDITDAIRAVQPDLVEAVDPVAREHTVRTVTRLRAVLGDRTHVVGAYYDVDTGVVELT